MTTTRPCSPILRSDYAIHSQSPYSRSGESQAFVLPDPDQESIIRAVFHPLPKNSSIPGVIGDDVAFASYIVAWKARQRHGSAATVC